MNCLLIIANRWIIGKKMGHFFSLVTSLFLNLPKSAFPWSFTIFQSPSWNLQNISMWKSMLPYKNDLSFLIKRKNCSCSWMLYYLTTNFSPFYCEIVNIDAYWLSFIDCLFFQTVQLCSLIILRIFLLSSQENSGFSLILFIELSGMNSTMFKISKSLNSSRTLLWLYSDISMY